MAMAYIILLNPLILSGAAALAAGVLTAVFVVYVAINPVKSWLGVH